MSGISRRDFLKGATATGLVIGGTPLWVGWLKDQMAKFNRKYHFVKNPDTGHYEVYLNGALLHPGDYELNEANAMGFPKRIQGGYHHGDMLHVYKIDKYLQGNSHGMTWSPDTQFSGSVRVDVIDSARIADRIARIKVIGDSATYAVIGHVDEKWVECGDGWSMQNVIKNNSEFV